MSDNNESWSEGRSYGRSRGWSNDGKTRGISFSIARSGNAPIDPHGDEAVALLERMIRERLDGEEFSDGAGI